MPQEQLVLRDIHARLERLEELIVKVSDDVGDVRVKMSELKAGLNGPTRLRDRVDKLESWRDKILGMVALASVLAGSSVLMSIFMRIW